MDNEQIDLKSLPVSQKLKIATELGESAGVIINEALKKVNSDLSKYGVQLSVTLNFHETKSEE